MAAGNYPPDRRLQDIEDSLLRLLAQVRAMRNESRVLEINGDEAVVMRHNGEIERVKICSAP